MINTSEDVPVMNRLAIVDGYTQKLVSSEYTVEETRRVRIAVCADMPLSRLLPSTNPWGAGDCERQDCGQDVEKQQNCKMRNILYGNQCTVCHVDDKAGKEKQPLQIDGKGVYDGGKFKVNV